MIKQRKNAGTVWDKKRKATQLKQMITLEEINQKLLAKEERQKDIEKTIQRKYDIPKQRKNLAESRGNAGRQTNAWLTKKQNNIGAKCGNEGNITEKMNG